MLKILSLAVGFNILGILALFQDVGVKVDQVAPLTLAPGETFEVKVNFYKQNIRGFAKYEVEVDDDLEVTVGEIGSASFTFENGIAKFIWFALPEEQNFTISYFLRNIDEQIGNEKNIYSQFSYLENNTKKVFELPVHKLLIEVYPNDSIVAVENVISTEPLERPEIRSEQQKLIDIRDHTVTLQREFERLDNGLYRMNIIIDKGPIEGFAKLEEVVPEGFEYHEENTTGAIFTKVKGKAKFVWFDLPKEEKINISYDLSANEANVIGLHNITGEFTYIVDDQDIVTKTVPAFFKISTSDMVSVLERNGMDKDERIVEEISNELWKSIDVPEDSYEVTDGVELTDDMVLNKDNEEEVRTRENDMIVRTKAESTTTRTMELSDENVVSPELNTATTSIPSDEQDSQMNLDNTNDPGSNKTISYRVQICAAKKVAERDYFKKHKNFKFDVTMENHEGWIKYTTGEYPLYARARKSRELIDQNYELDGPFVTAYNQGERITVQEALMISDQKWFQ